MSDLYNRIEALCKSKGITVTQLCRETGINRSTLSELNKGRTKSLSSKVAYKIATYFDVPLNYINENCVNIDPADLMFGKDKLVVSDNTEQLNEQEDKKIIAPAQKSKDDLQSWYAELSGAEKLEMLNYLRYLKYKKDNGL